MTPEVLSAALLAGFLSATSGLGAMLSLPGMLLLGLTPAEALLAIKLPIACADIAAVARLARRPDFIAEARHGEVMRALLGGALGACWVVSGAGLVPLLLAVGLLFSALRAACARGATLLLAVYTGAFGCGAGTFGVLVGRGLYRLSYTAALWRTRVLCASANLAAATVICTAVPLDWRSVLPIAIAQGIGAAGGASLLAIHLPARRPVAGRADARLRSPHEACARTVTKPAVTTS